MLQNDIMFSMKVHFAAVNASYMHTCLAIRSIESFVRENLPSGSNIELSVGEYTINEPHVDVIRKIAETHADMVLFSTYIWNAQVCENLISDVKNVLPRAVVGAGGPEFGYAAEKYLGKLDALDFVIFGEGERTVLDVLVELDKTGFTNQKVISSNALAELFKTIPGIYYRKAFIKSENDFSSGSDISRNARAAISFSNPRPLIENLDELPFSYPELLTDRYEPDNKIYYYESSRGCPYNCSYCLSSVDKTVRFKSTEKVFSELKIFLDANVKLVKFVDRTYNLNPERYISIWKYILENHNGKTMFHFEIEAEYLSKEALEFLQKVPSGVMQFEIGVQTSNKKTLKAINRSDNIEKLAENIRQIPRTIHQHLDLIAGLPYENLDSFAESFDFVMSLRPDALQLGFLKVLNGTSMHKFATENNYKWQTNAVYEVFSTPFMSFDDMMFLKDVETLVDEFWNKHIFDNTTKYIFDTVSPFAFFKGFCTFAREKGAFTQARRDLYWFELLHEYFDKMNLDKLLLSNLLRYDFVLTGKKGGFPSWYDHRYDKERHRELLEEKGLLHSTRLAFALTEYEVFDFDVSTEVPLENKKQTEILIEYEAQKR